jgi:excisionase family DNA binding protein
MTTMTIDQMLTTNEACDVLRCSRQTLLRLARRGMLAPVRMNARRNLYRSADIEALIDRQSSDDAAVIRDALVHLAERHAEDKRPICPGCTKRRVNPGGSFCTWCVEQQELQLHHKLTWWSKHGTEAKQRQRDRKAAT